MPYTDPALSDDTPAPDAFLSALDDMRKILSATYGPVVVSPPADNQSPLVWIFPTTIRYCALCDRHKPADAMHTLTKCRACAGI